MHHQCDCAAVRQPCPSILNTGVVRTDTARPGARRTIFPMENVPYAAPAFRDSQTLMGPHLARSATRPAFAPEPPGADVEDVLLALWETLSQALLVIDQEGKLVYANALGRHCLAEEAALRLGEQGVTAAGRGDRDRWRAAIGRAHKGLPQFIEIETCAGARVVAITRAPAPSDGRECQPGLLVVFIGSPMISDLARLDAVARHYRLTAAEIRVLRALLDDVAPKDVGALLDVATSTVRTHIRHLLQKTGTTGMRGLMSLIARFPIVPIPDAQTVG